MILTGAAVLGGLYLVFRGFRLLAGKDLVASVPTSKICNASLGLVEVGGGTRGPYTLQTPISGSECFLYRTIAWTKDENEENGEWRKVVEEIVHVPFFLD